ncbi:MAG: NAD-glutamate dehydrogenase domain-containing protein [Pseudomonadota bacterium]|jgi:glutamate dehydrogenase|uniref:NAD-glutamate dehydrogenase n=1 Tax=Qipengyuania pacifica TaxID=2860199 RepID=UPI002E82DD24|nr:NAD-glutamate dehydrogenase [Erythrobacter sp.]MEE2793740.1 NAD-glutamate dehydrogenase domain-containing protein [Pseudomonadota bacterium]
MGSKTAALPGKLQNAITERMRLSLLSGDTPFEKARLADAAAFVGALAADRTLGRSSMAIESVSDERRLTRIAIVNDDMPFLVDSVAASIAALGLSIDRLVHPVIPVERDKKGLLTGIPDGDPEDAYWESMIYIEAARVDAKTRRQLQESLKETLADVRAAVTDWADVQEAMSADAARIRESDEEGAELLEWLNSGMLTQLGHVIQMRDGSQQDARGICRKSAKELLAQASFERAFDWFDKGKDGRKLLIIKANHLSNVHRRVPLDLFIVPVEEGGKVVALSVHAGVWTSAALAAPPRSVPRLRRQLDALRERHGFDETGHAGKALVHALTTLPHDLLIGFSEEDVERVATTMMSLVDRPRPRLALVEAPLARHLFAFVWLPRDMVATQVRLEIQALLEEAAAARLLDWSLEVEGGNLATIRFVFDIRDGIEAPDEAKLEEQMQTLLRGWSEAVEAELGALEDPTRAAGLALRFAEHFPTGFRGRFGPHEAALDIARLHDLGASVESEEIVRGARLCFGEAEDKGTLRLKLYQSEGSLPLSEGVPALEDFGFYVQSEMPTVLDEGRLGTIHDFLLDLKPGADPKALIDRSSAIEEAIAAVLNAEAENDPFNRLVPEAGLSAREANWLRAFYRYLRQVGMSFTIYTVVDALAAAPDVTRALVALFTARHDPEFGNARDEAIAEARAAIKRGLSKVKAINDDRLLRLYNSLIDAILRTNAFAPASHEALAFKIDSAKVPNLPKPVPYREIFVYSRRVEGIHLRSGPVARGGLRWSDRRDDFRTEILGLMKAQRVKNAVIVPTGAKGGFYPKQLPNPAIDREAWAAEGRGSYETFIRTLLSVTDNIVDDKVVHPEHVVITDGEDPYFVVAADKGTATFSDIANAIAESRDFWLDDAFASGGSKGYDHKAMGITARGAWVSVQRHFREMGIDVQNESIEVVGCGDMSGDVFGNGMLLSKAIKLVAAFDHRHIFLDPDPDPAASWKERQRLFALPRSSWEDYDSSLISKGGGVFPRDTKSIKLSKVMQAKLGIDQSAIEPEALISAILKAPVDLIWFGGIGTYIKASQENNVQVGDPANDALRVDAADVKAKVIGEGANLGITQAARIEFSLHGGRCNTDFIDNSAGVDCSDNEVNIKIALAAAKRSGKLSEPKRVALLESMTDEVAEIVLEDNRLQALALSIAEQGGAGAVPPQLRLIEALEDRGALDRQTEGLASSEALGRRTSEGMGLTRPELAVLLSSTKLVLQEAIEQSSLPDDPSVADLLLDYFPSAMRKKFKAQIEGHQLRREIIATALANRFVNRMGFVHPFELSEEEGVGLADVTAAFIVADRLFGASELWAELETAAMPEDVRIYLFRHMAGALRSQMADLIRVGASTIPPGELITSLQDRVKRLMTGSEELLTDASIRQSNKLRAEFVDMGAPDKLAARVTHLYDLDGAVGLASLSRSAEIDVRELTAAFTDLGERIGLDWAQSTSAMMNPSDVWERLLVAGLSRDFQQMRLEFLRRLSRRKDAKKDPVGTVAIWAEEHAAAIRQFRTMVGRAQAQGEVAPATLAQVASMARNLLAR